MAKKKEKAAVDKKAREKTKGDSFLDNLRPTSGIEKAPTTGGSGHTKATGQTKIEKTALNERTKKIATGGVVAAAVGALLLAGLNFSSFSGNSQEEPVSDTPAVVTTSAVPEAVTSQMTPAPLAPKKPRLAEPAKKSTELAKPSKPGPKKSGKLASKGKSKSKDSVKKTTASGKKPKDARKSKKTLAAKSID